jgi:hypothetical protein
MRGEEQVRFAIQRLLQSHLKSSTGARTGLAVLHTVDRGKEAVLALHLSRVAKARNVMLDSHWSVTNHSLHQGGGGRDIAGFDPDNLTPTPGTFLQNAVTKMQNRATGYSV